MEVEPKDSNSVEHSEGIQESQSTTLNPQYIGDNVQQPHSDPDFNLLNQTQGNPPLGDVPLNLKDSTIEYQTAHFEGSFETSQNLTQEAQGQVISSFEQSSEFFTTTDTNVKEGLGKTENRFEEEVAQSQIEIISANSGVEIRSQEERPDIQETQAIEENAGETSNYYDERPIKSSLTKDDRPIKSVGFDDFEMTQNPFGEKGARYFAKFGDKPKKLEQKEKMVEEPVEESQQQSEDKVSLQEFEPNSQKESISTEKQEKMELVEEGISIDSGEPISQSQPKENMTQSSDERPLKGNGSYGFTVEEPEPLTQMSENVVTSNVEPKSNFKERPLTGKGAYPLSQRSQANTGMTEEPLFERDSNVMNEETNAPGTSIYDERPISSQRPADFTDLRPIGGSKGFNFGDERPLKKASTDMFEAAGGMEQEDPAVVNSSNEPLSSRVKSKVWKVRQAAFEELAKSMSRANHNDPIFYEYSGELVKFITDANPGAQEKAIDAFKAYVQKEGMTSIDSREAVKTLIDKALGPGKPNIKKSSNELLCLMFEKGTPSPIFDAITESINHKNQKTSCAGVQAVVELLANYGPKKLDYLKPFYPHVEKLASSTVSALRTEAMNFYKEAYKYMGDTLRPFLTKLKKAQLDELEKFFSEAPKQVATPLKMDVGQEGTATPAVKGQVGKANEAEFDAYDIVDPVDIFKKFNEPWSEKVLEQSKWSDRKAMLDDLLKEASSTVKIANTSHQHIATMLKRLLNDNNITVMVTAIKVYAALAKGLRKNFNFTCKTILASMLGKLKDKRAQTIDETSKALDNFLYCMTLDEALEDIKEALNDKTLEMKIKTLSWIEKSCERYRKNPEKMINLFKNLLPVVKKLTNDSSGDVRDVTLKVLAQWKSILGDSVIKDSYSDLPPPKLNKIQELVASLGESSFVLNESQFSKASLTKTNMNETPVASKTKSMNEIMEEEKVTRPVTRGGEAPKSEQKILSQRPSTAAPKSGKQTAKKMGSSKMLLTSQTPSAKPEEEVASFLTPEDAESKLVDLGLPAFICEGMNDSAWKQKLNAITNFSKWVMENITTVSPYIEHVIKYLKAKLKDWKESNINILKETFGLITNIVKNRDVPLTKRTFSLIAPLIIANIHDNKYSESCQTIVYAFIEATNPKTVVLTLINCIQDKNAKPNPKALVEMCGLLTKLIDELTLKFIPLKELIDFSKMVISNQNPASRTAATTLLKSVYQQLGPALNDLLNDVNPQTLKNLHSEFEKIVPVKDAECKIQFREEAEADLKDTTTSNPLDSLPRADISRDVEKLFKKLTDNDWKVRKEGLDGLENILTASGNRILPNGLTDFVAILKSRLSDNNKSQVKSFIIFVGKFAAALGSGIKTHSKVLLPELQKNLSDKQAVIRQETINSVEKFQAELGTPAIINSFLPLLSQESPEMKIEVINWILKNADSLPKADLKANVPSLLGALQDKTQEIRLLAEKLLEKCVGVIGTGSYLSALKDMKPANQKALKPIIEKYKTEGEAEGESMDFNMEQSQSQSKLKKIPSEAHVKTKSVSKISVNTASAINMNASTPGSQSVQKIPKNSSPRRGSGYQTSIQRPQTAQNPAMNTSLPNARTIGTTNTGNIIKGLGQKDKRQEEEAGEPWSLDELQDDLVDRLKGHLKMNVSPDLYAKMFSVDSKKHLDAVAILKKVLVLEFQGTVDILDLIARWFFMRLWDNSNSLLVKESLDYLCNLTTSLEAAEYNMQDFEAQVLISCLINKLSIANKNFQVTLQKIFQKLGSIYPPQKIAVFLFLGMNSQNPETRVECIGVLSRLVQAHGANILTQKDIKVFGRLLGHEDVKIREKAFTVLSEVGKHMGEDLLTLIENEAPEDELEQLKQTVRTQTMAEPSQGGVEKMQTESQEEQEQEHKPLYDMLSPDRMKVIMNYRAARQQQKQEAQVYEEEKQLEVQAYGGESEVQVPTNKLDGSQFSNNLNAVVTGNIPTKLNALVEIYDIVTSEVEENKQFVTERADSLLQAIHTVLHNVFEAPKTDINIKFTIQFLNITHKLCGVKHFLKNASEQNLQIFSEEILNRLLAEDEGKQETNQMTKADNDSIVKILNSTMLKVLENSDPSDMFSVLFELLIKNRRRINNYTKILGLIIKCILKLTKALEQLVNVIEPDRILLKSHMYLLEFGTDPAKVGEDIGIKTIKTILNELVKLYRERIWDYYAKSVQIHPKQDNYIHRWITVILRPLIANPASISPRYATVQQGATNKEVTSTEENQENISAIKDIVENLKRSDNFEEGVIQLHEILAANPGHSLKPYLKDSTNTFNDYVMMALERVKYQKTTGQGMQTETDTRLQLRAINKQNKLNNMSSDQAENSTESAAPNLDELHNKVHSLKLRYGLLGKAPNNENSDSLTSGQNQNLSGYASRRGVLSNMSTNINPEGGESQSKLPTKTADSLLQRLGEMRSRIQGFGRNPDESNQ